MLSPGFARLTDAAFAMPSRLTYRPLHMFRALFLFNHDQAHQVAHSLPIALALAETDSARVTIAVTTDTIEQYVRTHAGPALARCDLVRLRPRSVASERLVATLDAIIPARKLAVYHDNLDFFRGFDALVVPEKTSLLLKTRYGLDSLRLIHTRHGAGDRSIGFRAESAQFDLVLVAGPKTARRLIDEARVPPERIAIVGYAKFNFYARKSIHNPFPDPSKPTVLYNPHPSPKLSSWYRMGKQVLESFYHADRYNFVFAPHVMMFTRNWTVTLSPPAIRRMHRPLQRYNDAPHMLVDLGSLASSDMTYTNLADIYVGDVSSQVYEFLYRPRPCLHLDAQGVAWRDDPSYAHWQAGPVIGRGEDILAAVDRALATHGDYLRAQHQLLADTFSVTDEPASQRAARAIAEFMNGQSHSRA